VEADRGDARLESLRSKSKVQLRFLGCIQAGRGSGLRAAWREDHDLEDVGVFRIDYGLPFRIGQQSVAPERAINIEFA